MNRLNKNLSKFLVVCLALTAALFAGSCNSWMSDDGFVDKIESEVHDANAAPISVYIRYANSKMGTTDPSGYTSMKVDVASEIAAVTSDDYGFVKWAAFSTTDFPASQQHSSLFYESAEAYAEKFAPLELPASEIVFSTPTEPTTTVKIYKERNDIFIIPIVAKRPTVVTSVPSNGRSDVVRNTSIRILFSKKIDPASLKDEFGNSNIVITSGSAVLTETSGELGAKDITQNCTITLGKTGKMLTISPNKGYYFDNNSQITVNIYEDVCDTDGYGMNGKYSFSFTTGVKLDSLAPRIETLWAAPDADFSENNRFEQYKYIITGETEPVFKTAADSASNDIADYVAEDADLRSNNKKEILTQRVKDYLNIYVQASDIAGAGANVTVDQNTTSETDVALIQIRACLYIDKDGNPVTTSAQAFADNTTVSNSYYLETKDIGYAPGLKDSDCIIQKTFEEVFTDSNGQQTRNNGTLFTYDLRSLPDGLIKIDLWAVDMVGNSGETESYVKQEYNNNYRSIFVVKDTTKPDAAANKQFVVPSGNATADGYYNTTTYAGIKISGNTSIADAGNANLSSLNSKMKWIVKPTADTSWVNTISPTDSGWKSVTEDYSGFPTPASDGPVTLTYALMDDLGNISDAVQLDAIKYDGTNPTFSNLSFVADAGSTDGIVSNSYLNTQTLVIPLVEHTSGIKSLEFEIKQNGVTAYGATVADKSKLTVTIGDSTTAFTAYTTSGNTLTFDTPQIEFNSQIKIKGLTLFGSDAEGDYEVNVKVTDAAGNITTTNTAQKTNAYIDPVAPIVEQIYIPNLREGIWFSDSTPTSEYWADYNMLTIKDSNNTDLTIPRTDIYVKFTEATSGAKVFDFGGSTVNLTDDSQIYAVDSSTWAAAGYALEREVSTSNNTITIKNRSDTVKNQNGFAAVKITNVELASSTASGGSQVAVKINDTATNISDSNTATPAVKDAFTTITSKEGSVSLDNISKFRYDNLAPATSTFTISDKETETNCLDAQAGFTNNEEVNAKISITTSSAGSGIYSLTIDGAAEFDSATTIQSIDGSDTINYTFDVSSDKKTVTFKKNGKHALIQKSENSTIELIINNLKLTDPTTDGDKKVTIKSGQLSGVKNSGSSYTIVLDKTPPVWLGNGFYSKYDTRITSESVWPHPVNGEKNYGVTFGNDEDNVYFYRKESINVASDVFDKNYCNTRWKLTSNDDIGDSVNAYGSVTGKWDVFGYDKAGNTTSVKSMHVVADNSFASDVSDIDNYMTIVPPDSNSRFYINGTLIPHTFDKGIYNFRGITNENFDPLYSADYVIRQTDNPYVIKIKLSSGLSSQDTLLNGQAASDKDQYSGLNVSKTASPLEYYTVSHWYYSYRGYTGSNMDPDYTPFGSWMPGGCEYLSWHEYKKNSIQNNNNQKYKDGYKTQTKDYYIYSYVDSAGDIVIELPDYDCPPLTLIVKDGCGNITERLIKPTSFTGDNTTVSWVIDGEVGLPSYNNVDSTAWNNTNYLSTPNNSEVAFYRLNSESKTNLVEFGGTNGFSDTVRFSGLSDSEEGSESAYSMRSRVIAWPASSSIDPEQSNFNLASNSPNASEWYYMKEKLNNGNFKLQNELPKYDSVDPNGEGVAYKLYYIIEDYLGNCEIRQLKKSNSVELWLYDNTPPVLNVSEATKVNTIDGKNYYSTNSSVKYTIIDKLSGIQNPGGTGTPDLQFPNFNGRIKTYIPEGEGYSLGNETPSANETISISGVIDWAGNPADSVGLTNGGSNKWVRLDSAPELSNTASSTVVITDVNGKKFGETNSLITGLTQKWNTGNTKVQHQIKSRRSNTKITVQLKTTETQPLLGWIVKNQEMGSNDFEEFYSTGHADISTDVHYDPNTSTYTYDFEKTDSNQYWNDKYQGSTYFYAVNCAGLVCKKPIIITFESNPAPSVKNNKFTYSNVTAYETKNGSGQVTAVTNYFKSNSTITFTAVNKPTSYELMYNGGSVTGTLNLSSDEEEVNIPLNHANLSTDSFVDQTLKIKLDTGFEFSTEINIKGPNTYSNSQPTVKWTYDETAPVISIPEHGVQTKSSSPTDAKKNQFDNNDKTWYIEGDTAVITLSSEATDIPNSRWQWDQGTGTWTAITDTTNKKCEITAPTTATTYNFRAIDKAGNISEVQTVILKKDVSAPAGTVTYKLKNDDNDAESGSYTDSNGTIVYNTSKVNKLYINLTSVNDPDGNGLHFFKKVGTNDASEIETTVTEGVRHYIIELDLSDGSSQTYVISAKDNVGRETPLKTFTVTADGSAPEITIASVQSKNTGTTYDGYLLNGTYYLCRKNAIITFNTSSNDIAKYQVSTDQTNWTDITVTTNAYTFSCENITTATTYYFKAIDKVGYVSSAVSTKIVYDSEGPVGSVSHTVKTESGTATEPDLTANPPVLGNYVSSTDANGVITITYNPQAVKSIKFDDTNITDTKSGYTVGTLFYKIGSSETVTAITNKTLALSDNMGTDTYVIIAKDNVGNQKNIASYKFIADSTGPVLSKATEQNGINKAHSYAARKPKADGSGYDDVNSISYVNVEKIGDYQKANLCAEGTQILYAKTDIPDAVKYQIVKSVTTNSSDGYNATPVSNGWLPMNDGTDNNSGTNYIFPLPNVREHHTRLALFLMDSLGNVSVYYIGNKDSAQYGIQWWLTTPELNASNVTISNVTLINSNDAPEGYTGGWVDVKKDYIVSIILPQYAVVHSIALAPAPVNNESNAGVVYAQPADNSIKDQIFFTGYTPTDGNVLSLSTACINLAASDAVGLTLKIYVWDKVGGNAIGQTDVKVIINGIELTVFPASNGGGGNDPNANIRGSGLALLQGLVAGSGSSSGGFGSNKNFVPPVEAQEIVTAATTAPAQKALQKESSKKKAKKQSKSVAKVQAKTVVEKAVTQVQEVIPEINTIADTTLAATTVTTTTTTATEKGTASVTTVQSVMAEDIISATQEEKSSSKSALIVVMLAILSAAAGAWYLMKGRIKR